MKTSTAPPPSLATLVALTALSVLTLNMFLPSLPGMAREFQVDYGLMAVSIGGYLGVTALLMLVAGPLSDLYGRRPIALAGLALYTCASLGCLLTGNVWMFLAFRLCQGVIVTGWILSLAVIRDMLPPDRAASRIGYVTMAMAVAPMVGPMIGGHLEDVYGWRASFALYSFCGVLLFIICWFDLGETNLNRSASFSSQFRSLPELVRARRYWGFVLCMAFSTATFYGFLAGVPLVAVEMLGLPPTLLGFCLGTITAGFMLGSFLSGRLADRLGLSGLMIAGRGVACMGLLGGAALFAAGYGNAYSLFGATVFVGLGNGMTIPSCNAGAMSVRPDLAGSASGLAGAVTVGAGAVLTTLTGLIVTKETGAYGLLVMMFVLSVLGLLAALDVAGQEKRPAAEAGSQRGEEF